MSSPPSPRANLLEFAKRYLDSKLLPWQEEVMKEVIKGECFTIVEPMAYRRYRRKMALLLLARELGWR
jgi:hypothetical protein